MRSIPSEYRVFSYGKRRLLAISSNLCKESSAGASFYPGAGFKRAVIRFGIRSAIKFRLDKLISYRVDSELGQLVPFQFSDWLKNLYQSLNESISEVVVVWSSRMARKRVYVHLLNAQHEPVVFVKVALDAQTNENLIREEKAYASFVTQTFRTFFIPTLLSRNQFCGHEYLVFEPIPTSAEKVTNTWQSFPRESLEEFSGPPQKLNVEQLQTLDWWQRLCHTHLNEIETPAFQSALRSAIQSAATDGLTVCRVHGDMRPSNMVKVDGNLCIFDWETSADQAPYLTDEICFFLEVLGNPIHHSPLDRARKFAEKYLKGETRAKHDAVIALAYLHLTKIGEAKMIVELWEKIQ